MARKKHTITLAFLDLLFALFAALTMLNIMLAITKGRTAHRLEKDFLLVQVRWKESIRAVEKFEVLTAEAKLTRAGGGPEPEKWTHEQPLDPGAGDDRPLETIFFLAPLPGATWRFECGPDVWGHIDHFIVTTRRGPQRSYPRGSFLALTTTESGS